MSENEKAGSMKRANRVLLEFDTDNIPEGDVASQAWLDSIYDAFMRNRFDSLPDGVRMIPVNGHIEFKYVRGVTSAVDAIRDASIPQLGSVYHGYTVTSLSADCVADGTWKVWISGTLNSN